MLHDRPQALLVGAYERDNFGDILFLLLTEKYLGGVNVTAAAPLQADMTAVFGRYIPPYGPLLKTRRWDTVWSVGGEIGRVSLGAAFNYSLSPEMLKVYRGADPKGRSAIRRALSSDIDPDLAYVPTISDFPKNAGTNLVINSAGLGGISRFDEDVQERYLNKIRAAKIITVRDKASSKFLSSHKIDHHLSPDLVHAISLMYPADDMQSGSYLCVHAAHSYLRAVGNGQFATRLAQLASDTGFDIKLFVAGTAPGHDSPAAFRQIAAQAAAKEPARSFTVTEERHPMRLVEVIRRSRGWIGTSLHGRIIAESYGIPRVSLSKSPEQGDLNEKTAVYSATWDEHMPYAVPLSRMVSAVHQSLSSRLNAKARKHALGLPAKSHESMLRAVNTALDGGVGSATEISSLTAAE